LLQTNIIIRPFKNWRKEIDGMKRSQKICLSPAFGRVIFWQRNEVNFSQFLKGLDFFGSWRLPRT